MICCQQVPVTLSLPPLYSNPLTVCQASATPPTHHHIPSPCLYNPPQFNPSCQVSRVTYCCPVFVRTRCTSLLFDVVLVVNHRVLFCDMCKSFREPTLCLLLSIDDTADDTVLCYVEEV